MPEPARVEYRRYRAPREDRTALVEPSWSDVPQMVSRNRRCRGQHRHELHGASLLELGRQARRELVDAALAYTRQYRDAAAADPSGPLFLAGHQPQLFHPGVWFKNFALGELARRQGATAINLIVDSDTMKTHTVRVPGGTATDPHVAAIPLDDPGEVVPFEDHVIVNRELFATFADRAGDEIQSLVQSPLLPRYWELVRERMDHTDNLGECLAQARHQLEGQWGIQTLELPQSQVCRLEAFAWFAVHLLAELPRLLPTYNMAVQHYRRAHRIRSAAHPVPDLAEDGSWREAPFWVWTAQDPRRRRLFVCQEAGNLRLSDRAGLDARLPFSPGDAASAAHALLELGRRGVRVRSRALITTLWARLVLGDLFVHGIGGAKYDQVTDEIMARFFGIRPPGVMVVSATLQLPVERKKASLDDAAALDRQLRDLQWHPERRLVDPPSEAAELAAAKARWIADDDASRGRQRRREIRRINDELQPFVAPVRASLLDQQAALAEALRREKILGSREYAFCLYPENQLREFFGSLL